MTGPYIVVWCGPDGPRRWHSVAGIPYVPFNTRKEAEVFRLAELNRRHLPVSERRRHKVMPLAQFLVEAGCD